MPQPVKVSDELLDAARAAARLAHRSAAGQIEYWASLGRSVEGALTVSQIAGLMQGAGTTTPVAAALPPGAAPAPASSSARSKAAPRPRKPPTAVVATRPEPAVEVPQAAAEPAPPPTPAPEPPPAVVPASPAPARVLLSSGLASLPAATDPAVRRRHERVLEALRQRETAGRPVLVVVGGADAAWRQDFTASRLGLKDDGMLRLLGAGGASLAEVDSAVAEGRSVVVASDLSDSTLLEALRRWRQQGPLVLLVHLAGPATDAAARAARRFAAAALSSVDHLLELESITGSAPATVTEAW